MNNKEIKEIRKLYTKQRCSVSRLCGCYVSGEKEVLSTFSGSMTGMDDEELFKYLEIFKKCLSGSMDKNLFNVDIPLSFEMEDDSYKMLSGLRQSGLKNDELLEVFYSRIIDTYQHVGNYLILVAIDTYDIPGKSSLGDTMDDASEESFTYMLTAICPVELAKPGLAYNHNEGRFFALDRDWMVEKPEAGFMFPAFNFRTTDIHAALYYAKNADGFQGEFISGLFGSDTPVTAEQKKNSFGMLVGEVYGDEFVPESMKSVYETLAAEAEVIKNESDADSSLSKSRVRSIIEKSGADDEQMENFDDYYEKAFGDDTKIDIDNLYNKRAFTVKNEFVDIKISAERTDLVHFEEIGGKMCAVIELDGATEVNGVTV
ncbi:MAG: DUF4317 domain-containing protein [Eubacteriales bacterium]|nr:DUF4317 domain-containing protein [Eubacteriales bacterium]